MVRIVLFFIGLVSLTIFIVWFFGLILFVMSDSPHYGSIAYTPRWIFLLSIFVVFYGSRPVQRLFTKIEEIFS